MEVRERFVRETLADIDKIDQSMLKKLHHFYGHTSLTYLLHLLKSAGKNTKQLKKALRKMKKSCAECACLRMQSQSTTSGGDTRDVIDICAVVETEEWKAKLDNAMADLQMKC